MITRTWCECCVRLTFSKFFKPSFNYAYRKNFHTLPVLFRANPNWGSNKLHRRVKLFFKLNAMADPKVEDVLAPLRASVKAQVRVMFYYCFNFYVTVS